MTLSTNDAIIRFVENEERVNQFVNTVGNYSTNTTPPQTVETLPSFVQRLQQRYLTISDQGDWATSTVYAINDVVKQSGIIYLCVTPHTAGTFATDLSTGKWVVYQTPTQYEGSDYLATFFRPDSSALYIYRSSNAIDFAPIRSEAVYSLSGRVLRDPSIMYKDGYWWCVYSDVPSNSDFNTTRFGVAKSTNLLDWQHAFNIDSGTPQTWAPEWFVDTNGKVYVIVALYFHTYLLEINLNSGTIGTSTDLNIPGDSIDGTIVFDSGTYYLFVKNETTKYIERYTASAVTGPYTITGSGNWAGWGADIEGPSIVKLPDGTWRIYFDGYNAGEYYTSTASALSSNTWSAKTTLPQKVRHGSVIRLDDMFRRIDANSAQLFEGQAKYITNGQSRSAEIISAKAAAPMASAWMRLVTDADVAIFQSRYVNLAGFDFVNRKNDDYAAIEYSNGSYVDGVPIKLWGPTGSYQVEFPHGIKTANWQTPTFQNGWADGSIPFAYKINSEGLVKFAGIVAGGTATTGTVIFTLPVGRRPERTVVFPVVDNDTAFGSVGITATGDVVILAGSNTKLDLSSIAFYT